MVNYDCPNPGDNILVFFKKQMLYSIVVQELFLLCTPDAEDYSMSMLEDSIYSYKRWYKDAYVFQDYNMEDDLDAEREFMMKNDKEIIHDRFSIETVLKNKCVFSDKFIEWFIRHCE